MKGDNKVKIISVVVVAMMTVIVGVFMSIKPILPVSILNDNGYGITDMSISEFLKSDDSNSIEKSINNLELNKSTVLYKSKNQILSDKEGKNRLNEELPIYTNNGEYLLLINDTGKIIDSKFKENATYENMILNNGSAFNKIDGSQVDNNTYYFYKTSSGLFINLREMKFTSNNTKSYIIPKYSIINFSFEKIKYYEFKNSKFVYNEIIGIDASKDILEVFSRRFIYKSLLINIGLVQKPEGAGREPLPALGETPEGNSDAYGNIIDPNKYTNKDTLSNGGNGTGSGNGSGTGSGNGSGTGSGNGSGTGSGNGSGSYDNTEFEYGEGIDKEKLELIKRETKIKFDTFEAGVYSVKSSVQIEDPHKILLLPMTLSIMSDGKLKLKKPIHESGIVNIIGLDPDTEYQIIVTSNSKIGKKQFIEQEVYRQKIRTKTIDELGSVAFEFKNGKRFENKAQLLDFKIKDTLTEELKKSIKKIDFSFTDILNLSIDKENLEKLLNGETINEYTTPEILNSNTTYNFEISIFDAKGRKLKAIYNTGIINTIKAKPRAYIDVKSVGLENITYSYELNNPDNVRINKLKYKLYEGVKQDDKPLSNPISEADISFNGIKNNEFSINNLKIGNEYTLETFISYDNEDGENKFDDVYNQTLEARTSSLDTLGNTFFEHKQEHVDEKGVTIQTKIQKSRTNSALLELINEGHVYVLDENGEVKFTKSISDEDLKNLKLTNTFVEFIMTGLNSVKDYKYKISLYVNRRGKKIEVASRNSEYKFKTLKEDTQIIQNSYLINNQQLKLNFSIKDDDNSLIDSNVEAKLYKVKKSDNSKELMYTTSYNKGNNKDLIFNNVTNDSKYEYVVEFIADKYNKAYDDKTESTNKLLKTFRYIIENNFITSKAQVKSSNMTSATFNVKVNDQYNKIIDNKVIVELYNIDTFLRSSILKQTKILTISNNRDLNENIIFNSLTRNSTYKIVISVNVNGKKYEISSDEISTDKYIEEITEYSQLVNGYSQVSTLYVVTRDITANSSNRGSLNKNVDFKGNKLIVSQLTGSYKSAFVNIDNNSSIRNAYIIFEQYQSTNNGMYGLAEINNGTIENVYIDHKGTVKSNIQNVSGLVNINNSLINNVYMNFISPIYGENNLAGIANDNNGTISNVNITATTDYIINSTYGSGVRRISGVVINNKEGAYVDNIFVAKKIKANHYTTNSSNLDYIASIVSNNTGHLKNSLSLYNIENHGQNTSITTGPLVSTDVYKNVTNLFYWADVIKPNAINTFTVLDNIYDKSFVDSILTNGQYETEHTLKQGFQPILKLNSFLPTPQLQKLPRLNDSTTPVFVRYTVKEKDFESATIEFVFKHLPSYKLTSLEFDYLDVTDPVVVTENFNTVSRITVKVTPNSNKYLSLYQLTKLKVSGGADIIFQPYQAVIKESFYKPIYTNWDFVNIYQNASLNYYLKNDLDFTSISKFNIFEFSGILDGNNKTIYGIKGSYKNEQNTSVFSNLKGTIKNLNIDGFSINLGDNTNATQVPRWGIGFVGQSEDSSTIDNVHIKNAKIQAYHSSGVLVGACFGIIKNSSVTNSTIEYHKREPDNFNTSSGGLVGEIKNGGIYNSFVDGITFTDNVNDANIRKEGFGGLVGTVQGSTTIDNVYAVNSKIHAKGNSNSIGGLIGRTIRSSIYPNGRQKITNAYSTVDVSGKFNIGGIIGFVEEPSNLSVDLNAVAFGDVSGETNVYRSFNYGDNRLKGYVLEEQLVNGFKNLSDKYSTTISKSKFNNIDTYIDTIGFSTNNFIFEKIEEFILPKLKSTYGGILPNQKNVKITLSDFYLEKMEKGEHKDNGDNTSYVDYTFTFNNPKKYIIERIDFANELLEDNNNIFELKNSNEKTIIKKRLKPSLFKSNYYIKSITYRLTQEDSNELTYIFNSEMKGLEFNKYINSVEDYILTVQNPDQNLIIRKDLDFTNYMSQASSFINKSINKLAADSETKIQGITLSFSGSTSDNISSSAFIKYVKKIENIIFDNISININDTRKPNNYGVIYELNESTVKNLKIKNFTINSRYYNSIGFIRKIVNSNIDGIEIENSQMSNNNNMFADDTQQKASLLAVTVDNSTINNITVKLSSAFSVKTSGLIFAEVLNKSIIKDIVLNDIKVKLVQTVEQANQNFNHGIIAGNVENSTIESVKGEKLRIYQYQNNQFNYVNVGLIGQLKNNSTLNKVTLSDYYVGAGNNVSFIIGQLIDSSIVNGVNLTNSKIQALNTNNAEPSGDVTTENSNNYIISDNVGGVAAFMTNNSQIKNISFKDVGIYAKALNLGSIVGEARREDTTTTNISNILINNEDGYAFSNIKDSNVSDPQWASSSLVGRDRGGRSFITNVISKTKYKGSIVGGVVGYLHYSTTSNYENIINYGDMEINKITLASDNSISGGGSVYGLYEQYGRGPNNSLHNKKIFKDVIFMGDVTLTGNGNLSNNVGQVNIVGSVFQKVPGPHGEDYGLIKGKFIVHNKVSLNSITVSEIADVSSNKNQYLNNTDQTLEFKSHDEFKKESLYQSTGFKSSGDFDFSNIGSGYLPKLYYTSDYNSPSDRELLPNQDNGISIRDEYTFKRSRRSVDENKDNAQQIDENIKEENKNPLPILKAYQSDVDKLNLDLSHVYEGVRAVVIVEDKQLFDFLVKDRVYTLNYDFNTAIKIKLINGDNEKTYTFEPRTLSKNASVVDDENYFYNNNGVMYNKNGLIEGEFVNINGKYAIDKDRNVIDLITKEKVRHLTTNISLSKEANKLYEFEYNGYKIETYRTFTKVIENENITYKDILMFVKSGELNILDPKLDSKDDSYIIDSHLGEEYQTLLTDKGNLFDIKKPLKYPLNFINKDIKNITSNIKTDSKLVIVEYIGGKMVAFNYITGEEVELMGNKKENFVDHFMNSLKNFSLFKDNSNEMKKYKSTKEMEKYLNTLPSDKQESIDNKSSEIIKNSEKPSVIDNTRKDGSLIKYDSKNTQNTSLNNLKKPYTSVYNAETKKFDIYKVSEVMSFDKAASAKNEALLTDVEYTSLKDNSNVKKAINDNQTIFIYFTVLVLMISSTYVIVRKNKKTK